MGLPMALGLENELILNKTAYTTSDIDEYKICPIGGSPLTVGRIGNNYYLIVSPIESPFALPFTDNFNNEILHYQWSQVDATPGADAIISETSNSLSINVSACVDVWTPTEDDYASIYLPSITGDFEAIVKMNSQGAADPWTKCGIMTRNDIGTSHSAGGYTITAATPASNFIFQWDDTNDGILDDSVHLTNDATSYPCWLKTTRVGNTITGYYSTDGVVYKSSGNVTFIPTSIAGTISVGIFAGGIVPTTSTTIFDNFTIRSI